MKKIQILIVFILFASISGVAVAKEQIEASRAWDYLLGAYLHGQNLDYKGIKKEESKLDHYLDYLNQLKVSEMRRNEKKAFWINLYNACTVKLILNHYPISSIKKIKRFGLWGSPWKKRICRSEGKKVTLDEIEHGILRTNFSDPRVHFALVCASTSCPALRFESYDASKLNRQLEEQTKSFMQNSEKNIFIESKKIASLSMLFRWYGNDFGSTKQERLKFIKPYVPQEHQTWIDSDSTRIKYLNYDWRLNDTKIHGK